jgi:hypothetical protein
MLINTGQRNGSVNLTRIKIRYDTTGEHDNG